MYPRLRRHPASQKPTQDGFRVPGDTMNDLLLLIRRARQLGVHDFLQFCILTMSTQSIRIRLVKLHV